ncbi:MAG: hypothetical protein NTX53_10105 [candidate division WOR-3 bacterium]|nr:hypothetical protein [candidate division WOR-3 bacterium]
MATVMSPKRFRAELREGLLELHWRQWCALGVAGHVEPERRWVVDLEALVASTFALGREDVRLSKLAREWLVLNREWVSTPRLRRIGQAFASTEDSTAAAPEPVAAARGRAKVTRPVVTQPVLLQLQLRALFGMDVRADVFGYLLFNKDGNSSSIARVLYVDQKRVYNVLERWNAAGVVRRVPGGYSLVPDPVPASVAEARHRTEWHNWTATYPALNRLRLILRDAAADDRYVISSLFRDVRPEVEPPAAAAGVHLPPAERYSGAEYFEPFADGIMAWLRRLVGRRE